MWLVRGITSILVVVFVVHAKSSPTYDYMKLTLLALTTLIGQQWRITMRLRVIFTDWMRLRPHSAGEVG